MIEHLFMRRRPCDKVVDEAVANESNESGKDDIDYHKLEVRGRIGEAKRDAREFFSIALC